MKALQQIVKRVAENPSLRWALATLVQTEGSTYRKPGARLLIEAVGKTLGVLSGGCLEEEIGCCGKTVIALLAERHGVFVEGVPLPVRLLLFGSGPEIEPLSQFAGNLGRVITLPSSVKIFDPTHRPRRSL